MNKQTDVGNRRWYIFLTLFGTVIGSIWYFTGRSFPDLVKLIIKATSTPESTAVTMTPMTADVFVGLIDDYYRCINQAQHGIYSDYEICWNKLSNQPGEFQDLLNQSAEGGNGLKVYFDTWNDFKLGYALYFCDNKLEKSVEAEYFRYRWNDYINLYDKNKNYRKYSFGSDQNGPRIKSVDPSITKIDVYCELRVENWLPSQWTPTP